ncbi:MAG TPA: beta-ketoacyl synthase N-terminal-like domain-containing protein [Ktedonobacteraceae bacterium]
MTKYTGPIVITGMGAISPFGPGVEALWSALLRGERRTTLIESAGALEQPVEGAKVGEWRPADLLGKRGLQYLRPSTQFLLGASMLALHTAGLAGEDTQADDLGVTIGCNLVGLQSTADYDYTALSEGPVCTSPMEAPNTLANAPASHLAIRLKARALNTTIASGQCAGLDALGYAARAMREGRARQIVAGGVEELSLAALWVYDNTGILDHTGSANAGYPFEESSRGCLPSEGAAVVVLERQAEVLARGARPLAVLAGWSSGFAPNPTLETRARVLRRTALQALQASGLSSEDVDVVVSGANGLPEQDQAEAQVLQQLLAENPRVQVTAIKGTLGETYGAGGMFQTLAAICMFEHGLVPPTVSHERAASSLATSLRTTQTTAGSWPENAPGVALLLSQDLFGSTSAVVLRGYQAEKGD